MECIECYSQDARATPILKGKECLENHLQYICGTCGRCICVNKTEQTHLQRWHFPFKTVDLAKLYLRSAEVSTYDSCAIYELQRPNGQLFYKIFSGDAEFSKYLAAHKKMKRTEIQPVFKSENSSQSTPLIRYLSKEEAKRYLMEQQKKR